MKNLSRKFLLGAGFAFVAALTGAQTLNVSLVSNAEAQAQGDPLVPWFEADPLWPKPLPNNWLTGSTIGLDVDSKDNVWIVHRPGTLQADETYLTRNAGTCCTAAPDVLEFDAAGNLIRSWGRDTPGIKDHDWPTSNHGITVDKDGNVWLGANAAGQPPAYKPGSAEQFARRGGAGFVEGGGEKGQYHDSFLLKYTPDGKFLGEIGKANGSKGSLDTDNVRGVATIRFLPDGTLVAADGYGNHRVSEWDPKTMKNIRIWGAYGKAPSDDPIPHYDVNSPQFGNPVHCAEPSTDAILYVCDRTNNRVQLFKFDGTYLKQFTIATDTKGSGAAWEIAFSKDPAQKFIYLTDGANEKIHVVDRQSLKELYAFGGGGHQAGQFYGVHSIRTDSKGNIFTTETYDGKRVQKFIFKGLAPLSQVLAKKTTGNSILYR